MAWFLRLLHCFGSGPGSTPLQEQLADRSNSKVASDTATIASSDPLVPPAVLEASRDNWTGNKQPRLQQGLAECVYLAQQSTSEQLHRVARVSAGAAGVQSHPIHSFTPSPAPRSQPSELTGSPAASRSAELLPLPSSQPEDASNQLQPVLNTLSSEQTPQLQAARAAVATSNSPDAAFGPPAPHEGHTPAWKGQLSFTSRTPCSLQECATPAFGRKPDLVDSYPGSPRASSSSEGSPDQACSNDAPAHLSGSRPACEERADRPLTTHDVHAVDMHLLSSPVAGLYHAPAVIARDDMQLPAHNTPFALRVERAMQDEEVRLSGAAFQTTAAPQTPTAAAEVPPVMHTRVHAAMHGASRQPSRLHSAASAAGTAGASSAAAAQPAPARHAGKENVGQQHRLTSSQSPSAAAFAPAFHILARTPMAKLATANSALALPATPLLKVPARQPGLPPQTPSFGSASSNGNAAMQPMHTPNLRVNGRQEPLAGTPPGLFATPMIHAARPTEALQDPGTALQDARLGAFQTPSPFANPDFVWESGISATATPHIAGVDNPITNYRENKRLRCHETPFDIRVDRFIEAEHAAYLSQKTLQAGHEKE